MDACLDAVNCSANSVCAKCMESDISLINQYKAVGSIFDSSLGIFIFVASLVSFIALIMIMAAWIVMCVYKAHKTRRDEYIRLTTGK